MSRYAQLGTIKSTIEVAILSSESSYRVARRGTNETIETISPEKLRELDLLGIRKLADTLIDKIKEAMRAEDPTTQPRSDTFSSASPSNDDLLVAFDKFLSDIKQKKVDGDKSKNDAIDAIINGVTVARASVANYAASSSLDTNDAPRVEQKR